MKVSLSHFQTHFTAFKTSPPSSLTRSLGAHKDPTAPNSLPFQLAASKTQLEGKTTEERCQMPSTPKDSQVLAEEGSSEDLDHLVCTSTASTIQ